MANILTNPTWVVTGTGPARITGWELGGTLAAADHRVKVYPDGYTYNPKTDVPTLNITDVGTLRQSAGVPTPGDVATATVTGRDANASQYYPSTIELVLGTEVLDSSRLLADYAVHTLTAVIPADVAGRALYWQIRTKDADGTSAWAHTASLTIGAPAEPVVITDPGPQSLTVGEPYELALTATPGPLTWTADNLPPGLALDAELGTITGTPTLDGQYGVLFTATNTASAEASALLVTMTVAAAAPTPGDSDPWAALEQLAAVLAPRVAAFMGRHGDPSTIETATAQLPVVAEYVRGYTRGRGWAGDAPTGPLRVVIVSATARLAANPEQVWQYQTGDYSERPAVLAGWTLAELAVLRRYRKVSA